MLLAVGCTTGRQASPQATGSSTADGGPIAGGTLNLRIIADFFDFDPSYNGKTAPNPDAQALVYETLLRFKSGPDVSYDELTVVPGLAERWDISADARTFTFHLRKGVKFANVPPVSGRELTSADIKFSYEYASRTGEVRDKGLGPAGFAWMFEGLDRIETPDASTVVVSFKQPFAPFLNYAATDALPIVAREVFEQDGHFRNRLVGTGPFVLDSAASQTGTRWVFKKRPDYWEAGKPYLDEVRYLVIPEDTSAQPALQAKQVDIAEFTTLQVQEMPGLTGHVGLNPAPRWVQLYTGRPPFDDIRLRKAVALAVDRDEFIKVGAQGKGGWAMLGAFPDTWTQEEIKQIQRQDLEEARRLVTEAGFPNGIEIELMGTVGDPVNEQELLQAQLKKVGINLTIKNVPKAERSTRLHDGQFAMTLITKALYGDVDSFLTGTYHSAAAGNYQAVKDSELDRLMAAQRQEPDPVKRREHVRQASRYITENSYGVAIYRSTVNTFWHPYIKNFSPRFQLSGFDASKLWLQK
jgi:peptide/nickel transport system substrate-binding protein